MAQRYSRTSIFQQAWLQKSYEAHIGRESVESIYARWLGDWDVDVRSRSCTAVSSMGLYVLGVPGLSARQR